MADYEHRSAHLLTPEERELKIDPALEHSLEPERGPLKLPTLADMSDILNAKPPGADFDAMGNWAEEPAKPGFKPPKLPFGLDADKDGLGTTLGDQKVRFKPYIPGLIQPEKIDPVKKQKEFMDRADELHRETPRSGETKKK